MSGAEPEGVLTNKKAWSCVFEVRLYKLAVVFDETYSHQVSYITGKIGFEIFMYMYIFFFSFSCFLMLSLGIVPPDMFAFLVKIFEMFLLIM